MAWLEQHPTSGRFKICFRWGGRKLKKTVRTDDSAQAEAALLRFQENLDLLERGRLELPAGADLATFLLSDGKLTQKVRDRPAPKPLTLAELRDRYLQAHAHGVLEDNSLQTVRMHLRHFAATLGESFPAQALTLTELQGHVDRRARKQYRGRPLSPVTLRKEMASLRAAWNWAAQAGLVTGPFPGRGLKYPKTADKPPFQTRAEIERQVARGGLSKIEQRELWDCLFLTLAEVAALLAYVKEHAAHPWLYPMACLAAHTGARRSELLRARVQDLDLDGGTVLLHEKKRARGRRTTRRVPLSPLLAAVLKGWLARHPGGPHLFCQEEVVERSKKRSRTTGHQGEPTRATTLRGRLAAVRPREQPGPLPVSRDEAHDHFKRTLAGSRWAVLRGWHVLRHSFASNLAARGVDQRVIDEWMGHQTEEMRKRYRHLFPEQQRQAIRLVFGEGP
jgi:integrase